MPKLRTARTKDGGWKAIREMTKAELLYALQDLHNDATAVQDRARELQDERDAFRNELALLQEFNHELREDHGLGCQDTERVVDYMRQLIRELLRTNERKEAKLRELQQRPTHGDYRKLDHALREEEAVAQAFKRIIMDAIKRER